MKSISMLYPLKINSLFKSFISQSKFQAFFIRKNYHEFYSTVLFNSFFVTIAGKIVIISEKFKSVDFVIINAFKVANAFEIILMARNEIIFKQMKNSLQAICINIKFSYWVDDITNIKNIINMFNIVRQNLKKSNILIFGAAYLHSLNQRLNVLQKKLNRSFNVNFKVNVNFVQEFLDSQKSLSRFKIIINLTIVTTYIRQSNMSTYGTNKETFVIWLKHVHFENQNKLKVFNSHPDIVSMNTFRNYGFRANNWNWNKCQTSFVLIS